MAYQQFITSDGESLVDSNAQDFYSLPITHILYAPGFVCESPAVSIPGISQVHGLSAVGIETGDPAVAVTTERFIAGGLDFIGSDGDEFRISLDEPIAPDISQNHQLLTADIAPSNPVISTPQISQNHGLEMSDILVSSPAVSIPGISQVHGLFYQDLLFGNAFISTCAITQSHILSATNIVSEIPNISMSTLYVSDVFLGGGNRIVAVLK